jgi:PilZ domain
MRERRQVPRYKFNQTGRLVSAQNEILSDVAFITLSVRGCRVKGSSVPAVGQKCRLVFEWEGKQFEDTAEIMWKKQSGDAGLTFPLLTDSSLQLIRSICSHLHLEPMTPTPPESEEDEA